MRRTVIFLGIILLLLSSCGQMQAPVFNHIENVKINKLNPVNPVMTFDVECFNPNNKRAKLKEAEGDAWADSSYLGHFFVDTLVSIPAKANFTVPVRLNADINFLLKYSLFGFRKEDVLVTIKGTAKVGKAGIYKKIPLHYEGKQNLAGMIN